MKGQPRPMRLFGVRHVLHGITHHYRTRWVEWCLALMLLGQSLQLLSARDLSNNHLYRVLASMVREATLAHFALAFALSWLGALTLNGTFAPFRRLSPWVRAACTLGAACYWMFWSITLFRATGPVTSVSWINHGGLSMMAALCFLWTAQEVAVADERAASWKSRRPTNGSKNG